MPPRERFTTLQLVGRSLLPSTTSLTLCVCFAVLLIVLHCLLLTIAAGTALPGLLDGQWATFYTNTVVQPIEALFNNLTFNNAMTILLWGALGLAVYSVVEFGVHLYKDGEAARHDIQIVSGRILPHPTRKSFVIALIWRAAVLLFGLAFVTIVHMVPEKLLVGDSRIVAGTLSLDAGIRQVCIAVAAWTALGHFCLVLVRLFLMRTRLFGDERIE